MATEGTPTQPAQTDATTPVSGALALLTATALGGLIGSRAGPGKRLAMAAGAAALALLSRRGAAGQSQPPAVSVAPSPPLPPAFPPVVAVIDPRVEDWLARQMDREQRAEAAETLQVQNSQEELLPTVAGEATVQPPDDDYVPEPLLSESLDEEPSWQSEAFSVLTEKPSSPPPLAPPAPSASPAPVAPSEVTWPAAPTLATETAPLLSTPSPPRPVAAVPPPPPLFFEKEERPVFSKVATASGSFSAQAPQASIPGIEPLPSWQEPAPSPAEAPFTANGVELESLFSPSLFQGASLPDEIQVPVSQVPTPSVFDEDPMASLFKFPEPGLPSATPPPSTAEDQEQAPEISVHIAAPGEAWFDSPLAGIPNPWTPPQPEADVPAPPAAPPSPSFNMSPGPVVDAEMVLRPRAPVQSAVVPKNMPPPSPAAFVKDAAGDESDPSLPRAPVQSPREQRARSTWRSWWKGD